MSATRNILKHCRFETAAGTRTCDVNKEHSIAPGEKHFAYEAVPGQRKNICMSCTPAVLKVAEAHLASLLKEAAP